MLFLFIYLLTFSWLFFPSSIFFLQIKSLEFCREIHTNTFSEWPKQFLFINSCSSHLLICLFAFILFLFRCSDLLRSLGSGNVINGAHKFMRFPLKIYISFDKAAACTCLSTIQISHFLCTCLTLRSEEWLRDYLKTCDMEINFWRLFKEPNKKNIAADE